MAKNAELIRRALEEQTRAGQHLFMMAIQAAGGSVVIPDHLVASFDPAHFQVEATQEEGGWRYTVRPR